MHHTPLTTRGAVGAEIQALRLDVLLFYYGGSQATLRCILSPTVHECVAILLYIY